MDASLRNTIWSHTLAGKRKSTQVTAWSPGEQTNGQNAGNLVGLGKNVDSWKTSCDGNGLVAIELGCDCGGLGSIPTVT